jgi:carbon storage regulator
MLVLSRKIGQELVIGDNIRITINRVGGSRVTLGISAPDNVRIMRAELEPVARTFESTGPNNKVAEPAPAAWLMESSANLGDLSRQVH